MAGVAAAAERMTGGAGRRLENNPAAGGTRLTEVREEGTKPLAAKVFNAVVPRRDEKVRAGMAETLDRIKAAAEAAP